MKTPTLKTKPAMIAGGVAALALAMGAVSLTSVAADDKKEAQAPARPALTVTSARPAPATLPVTLGANGNIAAWQEASIGSEVGGLRLAEVRVNVGDTVKKGEVLAVFAADTVQADVAQAKAALAEATANASEATANAARARTLQNSGALSAQQISQYLTAEQTAKARIASAKAVLASQELRMKYTKVTAPDSGVISARSATVGAVVGVGTELFRLIRQGRLEWRAEVTPAELPRLKKGGLATVRAPSGAQTNGKIRMIAPTIDLQNRAALVYVDLPAERGTAGMNAPFKAGMFATGTFELGQSQAMTVPQQSVVVRDGFNYVFRVGSDSRVSQLKVQTGRRIGDRIEVLSGLNADASVAVNGAGFLNDGDLVRVVSAPAPLPAGGSPARAAK
jgi:RND family efflux transporter MFP subunit